MHLVTVASVLSIANTAAFPLRGSNAGPRSRHLSTLQYDHAEVGNCPHWIQLQPFLNDVRVL